MWFVIDMDKVSDCGAQNYGYLVLGGSLGYDLRGVRTVGIYPTYTGLDLTTIL